jgi:hypothetical protein
MRIIKMVLFSAPDVEGPAYPREGIVGLSRSELSYSSQEPTLSTEQIY